jgi:hypothetical protein
MRLLRSALPLSLVLVTAALHGQEAEEPQGFRFHATPQVGLSDAENPVLGLQLGVRSHETRSSLVLGVARHGPFTGNGVGILTVVEGGASALRQQWIADAGYEFSLGSGAMSPYAGFGAGAAPLGGDARVLMDVRAGLAAAPERGIRAESRLLFGREVVALVVSLGYRVPLGGG